MKLSSRVKILQDNGTIKEVKGSKVEYNKNGITLPLIVHESIEAWETELLKISEETTGLGMCIIKDKKAHKVSKDDIINAVDNFIKEHSIEKIREVIQNTKTISEREELLTND